MISVIIPTYNESETILNLILYLKKFGGSNLKEIIVCDGGSQDDTLNKAKLAGAEVYTCAQNGRASQMNFGASIAQGSILYFVHADCLPPKSFAKDIRGSIQEGYSFGRFRTKFDSKNKILKINAFVTRFDLFIAYGGDKTLFIK
ncbi:MAG: hypothetical protein NVS1B13_02560 [Flavisolibacter sp.]